MTKKRVIIDTNCWISFLIGKRLSSLVQLLVDERVQVIICEELLEEISDVTCRPKFARYFPADEVRSLLSFLRIKGIVVEPDCEVNVCRDACDNYLLALANSGNAR